MSTKDFGCFFCVGKATDESATCPNCGKQIDISQELTQLKLGEYQVTRVLGRGFNGWTVLAEDNFQSFAIKIIPKHRLKEGGLKEPRALVACSSHRNIARFIRVFECDILIGTEKISGSCLVFEYVPNARPLRDVVDDDSVKLSKGDVVAILCGIASGLARMHTNSLWHDDLHDDNILIRKVQADENLTERYEAKLIDFGSTKPRNLNEQETGDHGDYSYLSKHIYNLVQRFEHGNQMVLAEQEQDAVVKRFAQRQLADLRNIADYGMKLHTFANCMGDLIKCHLLNSTAKKPDERLRIEIEGTGDMGYEAQRMHEALLRHSVLVSGGAGKSKAGLPTKKLYFRRMFAPCFPFSPHRSGCIAITVEQYERWLIDPRAMDAHKPGSPGRRRRKKHQDPGTLLD